MSQREIAKATDMDEGFTSRIVSKLEEDELISGQGDGAISVRDPDLLLEAWREDYEFSKHRILRGHAPARFGDALLGQLSRRLREDAQGANMWLVVPNDQGVFHGAADWEGVRCVHPVQVYLDLLAHPERAREVQSGSAGST